MLLPTSSTVACEASFSSDGANRIGYRPNFDIRLPRAGAGRSQKGRKALAYTRFVAGTGWPRVAPPTEENPANGGKPSSGGANSHAGREKITEEVCMVKQIPCGLIWPPPAKFRFRGGDEIFGLFMLKNATGRTRAVSDRRRRKDARTPARTMAPSGAVPEASSAPHSRDWGVGAAAIGRPREAGPPVGRNQSRAAGRPNGNRSGRGRAGIKVGTTKTP